MRRRAFTGGLAAAMAAGTVLPTQLLASAYAGVVKVAADVPALTIAGKEQYLPRASVQSLADSLRNPLLLRGDVAYDLARQVLNPLIDKYPALVVQPSGTADVCTAVSFAAEYGLEVAVKCGGHSFAGKSTCEGGMQIDLSRFRGALVDPEQRVAYVAGGSLLGELDHESMAHGLATTSGTVSHTGVGGLTTGGGFGRLARRYGLALDNLVGVEVVAADGKAHRASASHNPDLFWAVRGGGSNFGVVTTFKFQLHPLSRQVLGGPLIFPIERARDVLEAWAAYAPEAPDELYIDPVIGHRPGGKGGFALLEVCYCGEPSQADAALKPLRDLGKPKVDRLQGIDYVALQRSGDSSDPRATSNYVKGGYVGSLNQALVDACLDGLEPDPDRYTSIYFQHAGGAISRTAPDATAFPHRYAVANLLPMVGYLPQADVERHKAYVRKYWKGLEPHTRGFYTNEADDQAAAEFNQNYQGNYPRLRSIKKRYDPDNLFRLNANIT